MKLKDLLKTFDEDQYVDICCGVDKYQTPKTIYYGRAKVLPEAKNVLEWFEKFEVKHLAAYIDDVIENEKRMVIMITIKES